MEQRDELLAKAQSILAQVRKAVVGKDRELLWVLAAILAGGHILVEDILAWARPPWHWPFPKHWV